MLGFGKNNKLSQDELDRALDQIRSKYNDFIITYMKEPAFKDAFEDRYYQVIRDKLNIELFIKDEIEVLKELTVREQSRIQQEQKSQAEKSRKKEEEKGFADRLMDEFREQISSYPLFDIHPQAAEEISRLYGAIKKLDEVYWPILDSYFRQVFPGVRSRHRSELDRSLWNLTSHSENSLPPGLERYVLYLGQGEKSFNAASRESQNCIKQAAFFMHDLEDAVVEGWRLGIRNEEVEDSLRFIRSIIKDFRLKEIKKQ